MRVFIERERSREGGGAVAGASGSSNETRHWREICRWAQVFERQKAEVKREERERLKAKLVYIIYKKFEYLETNHTLLPHKKKLGLHPHHHIYFLVEPTANYSNSKPPIFFFFFNFLILLNMVELMRESTQAKRKRIQMNTINKEEDNIYEVQTLYRW